MITLSKVLAIMIICLVNPVVNLTVQPKFNTLINLNDLIDLGMIRNVYINEEELVEIK